MTTTMRARLMLALAALIPTAFGAIAQEAGEAPVGFAMHRIGTYRSEACGVGDFDGDGRLDIIAGPNLYLAPDFDATTIRAVDGAVDEEGKGYADDFVNVVLDVDRDGKPDLVTCTWFAQEVAWYRNSLGALGEWPKQALDFPANFESCDLGDIDNDGDAREILAHTQQTVWMEYDGTGVVAHVISEKAMNFGGGIGDLNGDGRADILRPDAWFEGPEDAREGEWIEHPWALGAKDGASAHTPQMLIYDVNDDGLNDVVTSNAHGHGIFWYEQRRDGDAIAWVQHIIDDTWSQAHSLGLADFDADGDLDLVTGKRFMAHNGGDPDAMAPLGVYWYELDGGPEPAWAKHVISYDEGIGSGVSLSVADLDADGDPDIIVTGKWGGPVWFENTGPQ